MNRPRPLRRNRGVTTLRGKVWENSTRTVDHEATLAFAILGPNFYRIADTTLAPLKSAVQHLRSLARPRHFLE